MVNTELKNEVIEEFRTTVADRLEKNLSTLDIVGFMKDGNTDLVKQAVEKIKANIIASIPTGINIPGISLYISCTGSGNEITVVNISINSKVKATKKFKYASSFVGDNIVSAITDFFAGTYENLIIDELAEENCAVVNEVLARAAEIAGVPYKVSVATYIGGTKSKLAYIDNDEIVFYADLDTIFTADTLVALREPDEVVSEEAIEDAIKQIAESFEEAQTTEQLVAALGGVFIRYIANITKQTKGIKLIQQVCNRNVRNLKVGQKDTIAYYLENDVYALVAQREGNLEVILSPFNVETFTKADVDVLKEIA